MNICGYKNNIAILYIFDLLFMEWSNDLVQSDLPPEKPHKEITDSANYFDGHFMYDIFYKMENKDKKYLLDMYRTPATFILWIFFVKLSASNTIDSFISMNINLKSSQKYKINLNMGGYVYK